MQVAGSIEEVMAAGDERLCTDFNELRAGMLVKVISKEPGGKTGHVGMLLRLYPADMVCAEHNAPEAAWVVSGAAPLQGLAECCVYEKRTYIIDTGLEAMQEQKASQPKKERV